MSGSYPKISINCLAFEWLWVFEDGYLTGRLKHFYHKDIIAILLKKKKSILKTNLSFITLSGYWDIKQMSKSGKKVQTSGGSGNVLKKVSIYAILCLKFLK